MWTHACALTDKLLQAVKCFWILKTQGLSTLFVHAEIEVYEKFHSNLKLFPLCLPVD